LCYKNGLAEKNGSEAENSQCVGWLAMFVLYLKSELFKRLAWGRRRWRSSGLEISSAQISESSQPLAKCKSPT